MTKMKKCLTAIFAMAFTFGISLGGVGVMAATAESTTVEAGTEATRINLPTITLESKTFMTLVEAGIDEAVIWASVPEKVEPTYTATENGGVISMADIGGDRVQFVSFADWNHIDLTLENGVWSAEIVLSQTDFESNDYFLYIFDEYDTWKVIYLTSEISSILSREENKEANFSAIGGSYLYYRMDSLNITNDYKNGVLYTQRVRNSDGRIEVHYSSEGDLTRVNVYIDDWYYYYPDTGWQDGNVPAGYEDADAAYFMELLPCQIGVEPTPDDDSASDSDDSASDSDDPNVGEEATRINLPTITLESKTFMTLAEAGIDKAAIFAGVPEKVELTYTATENGGIISFADIGGDRVEFYSFADWNPVDLTLENGVWSVEIALSQTDFESNDYYLYILDKNMTWEVVYRTGELSSVLFREENKEANFTVNGDSYLYYRMDSLNITNYYEDSVLYVQGVCSEDGRIEVSYSMEGEFIYAYLYQDNSFYYYPDTGWRDGNVPAGYENADAAYFMELLPCQIHFHNYTVKNYDKDYHWMECACGEVDESSLEAHMLGEDDGDCTTEILCAECDKVMIAGTDSHYGGEATCEALAECMLCGTSYGDYADHIEDSNDGDCTTDILCTVCDEVMVAGEASHSGGEATCETLAECTVCGTAYGDYADHIEDSDDGDCTTDILCTVCDEVVVEGNAYHYGGKATCKTFASCAECGKRYGSYAAHTDKNDDGICDVCEKVLREQQDSSTEDSSVEDTSIADSDSKEDILSSEESSEEDVSSEVEESSEDKISSSDSSKEEGEVKEDENKKDKSCKSSITGIGLAVTLLGYGSVLFFKKKEEV